MIYNENFYTTKAIWILELLALTTFFQTIDADHVVAKMGRWHGVSQKHKPTFELRGNIGELGICQSGYQHGKTNLSDSMSANCDATWNR
jgi:hypothetical protein